MTSTFPFGLTIEEALLLACLLGTGVLLPLLGVYGFRRRRIDGALAYAGFCLCVGIYAVVFGVQLLSPSLDAALWLSKIEYIGIAFMPGFALLCIIRLSGNGALLNRKRIFLLWLIPLITYGLKLTDPYHHLIYRSVSAVRQGAFLVLRIEGGLWYWVNIGYINLSVVVSTVLLLYLLFRGMAAYRQQAALLLIGILPPWIGHLLYLTHLSPLGLDFSPIAFSITGIIWALGLSRVMGLELVPIAKEYVFAGLSDPVMVVDIHNRIVDCNPSVLRCFGIERREAAGRPAEAVFHEFPEVASFLASGEEEEEIALQCEGERKVYRAHASWILDAKGRRLGKILTLNDISEIKKGQEFLMWQNAFQRALVDISGAFVNAGAHGFDAAIQDALSRVGVFLHVDRSYVFLLDWRAEVMTNTHEWCAEGIRSEKENLARLPFSMVPQWIEEIRASKDIVIPCVKELPPAWTAEKEVLEGQGIQSLAVVPMVCDQTVVGFVGFDSVKSNRAWKKEEMTLLRVMTDLLAGAFRKRRVDEALQTEKRRFQLLIQQAPFGMVLIRENGEFAYANTKFTEILGYDLSDVPNGKAFFHKAYPDPQLRREATSAWVQDRASYGIGEHRARTFQVAAKGGETRLIHFMPVKLETGEDLLAIEDITERTALETRVSQAQKMESIGLLAGGIAHDFNNLLQGIGGYAELLLLGKDDKNPDWPRLWAIRNAVNRAAQLIRQLLLFSRKAHAHPRPVDLNHEIEEAARLLERTIPKMIAIRTYPGENLWKVNADPVQMEQMLLNLASNAADAMPEGGTLLFETENAVAGKDVIQSNEGAVPGRYVLLNVSDTGYGMNKETVAHIFEPFFTTKEIGKGTGLGLASVYGIVKGHNGHIACYSEPGQGTLFKIYLPALEPGRIEDTPENGMEIPKGGDETILVVDDEEDIRDMLRQTLQHFGYHAIACASGEEAVEQYRANRDRIALVVLDLNMPGMGGRKCMQALADLNPEVKIVIASGYFERDQAHAGSPGEAGFMAKPFNMLELMKKIREMID